MLGCGGRPPLRFAMRASRSRSVARCTSRCAVLRDGQWSALNEVRFYANDLRVTEINYQPHAANLVAGMGEAGVDASQFEFVELANTGSQPLDLSGVRFASGIEFVFADNTLLGPGQRTVVVANPAAFQSRYGAAVAVAGQFAGDLANDGERIELRDKDANALVSLDYGVDDPWPRCAAGVGSSLEAIDPLGRSQTRPTGGRALGWEARRGRPAWCRGADYVQRIIGSCDAAAGR